MKKFFRLIRNLMLSLLAICLLVLVSMNLLKFAIYSQYYSMETELCKNPGINDGFICQGICVSEENNLILVSGYMQDKSNSRIYITDLDSNSYYVRLTTDGKPYAGHAGGIALTGDKVYISNASKLYITSLNDLLNAENDGIVDIGSGVKVNCAASYVYADEEYVYVGEYNNPEEEKQKEHPYDTPNGHNRSIVTKYAHDDLQNPVCVYSVGNYVQGVCFTPDGKIILSTSHGFTSSVYYVYLQSEAYDSGYQLDGAPVYFLGNCVSQISGPAMGEDLDWYNGQVITLSESASNKYILGKFFFADDIVSLDFNK